MGAVVRLQKRSPTGNILLSQPDLKPLIPQGVRQRFQDARIAVNVLWARNRNSSKFLGLFSTPIGLNLIGFLPGEDADYDLIRTAMERSTHF